MRLYFAPETTNLSVHLKKIPIDTFRRLLDLKMYLNEQDEEEEDPKQNIAKIEEENKSNQGFTKVDHNLVSKKKPCDIIK